MSAMRSMKIDTTMPKLAGNSISASTTTAVPPSPRTRLLIQPISKWAQLCRPHQASAPIAICSTSDSASDCQITARSRGSPSWPTASSQARIMSGRGSLCADHAGGLQLAHFLRGEAALQQHLVGVLAALGGRALDAFLGAREARRGGGLREALDVDIGVARLGMRMLRGLLHGEHRREADVGALHDRAPFVARLGLEDAVEPALELGPRIAVVLRRQVLALEPGLLQQQVVELRLDRADRDVLAVLGLVGAVEMRAAVEQVHAALAVLPDARAGEAIDAAEQQRRAVDHRGIDHLALARALRLEESAHHAEGEQHAAAAEIAHQVE